MGQTNYLTAQEAAAALNITVTTLYSYVSRGLIRSEATPGKTRARRYSLEDVERLKQRQAARQNPLVVAEKALNWGDPVLDSAITLIDDGRLYYRGYDVLDLARSHTFEAVIDLLWSGELKTGRHLPPEPAPAVPPFLAAADHLNTFERFQVVLPATAAIDLALFDRTPAGDRRTGRRILSLLLQVAAPQESGETIAGALQQAWAPQYSRARFLLNAALILCADHELNASSFAVRVVASTGASLYAAVQAGLAALQGPKHGGITERVTAWIDEAGRSGLRAALAGPLRRGEKLAGFGHPLYQAGDPRGRLLLELIQESYPDHPIVEIVSEAEALVEQALGQHGTIDLGLATLAAVLELPDGAPLTIFTLGRSAGWIAHALEQYETDQLIRPRARYVGRMPV